MRTLFLSLFFLLPSPAFAIYKDIPVNHINEEAISTLQWIDVVHGYPDMTFRPSDTINRVELLTLLVRATFTEEAQSRCDASIVNTYSDTSDTTWYSKTLCVATQHGIVSGYPDGTFKPDQPVTVAEAMKIIVNAGKYQQKTCDSALCLPVLKPLGSETSSWYVPYAHGIQVYEAIPTTIVSFDQKLTRGEMAEILWRLMRKKPALDWRQWTDVSTIFTGLPLKSSSADGISFSYPSEWPKPVIVKSEIGNTTIGLGDVCKGCAEGDDKFPVRIFMRPYDEQILKERTESDLAQPVYDHTDGGRRVIVWTEGGYCGYITAWVIENGVTYEVETFCGGDSAEATRDFLRIVKSIKINPVTVSTDWDFDGCGKMSTYNDRTWYPALKRAADERNINITDEEWVGAREACYSQNMHTLLFIAGTDYCKVSELWKFDTMTQTLSLATVNLKGESDCAGSFTSFGKRTGNIIQLKGAFGDAGYSAVIDYDYDLSEHSVTLKKSCGSSFDEPVKCMQY